MFFTVGPTRLWMVFFAYFSCLGLQVQQSSAEGARILAIETYPGKSHWNFMSSILRALTDAGHRVTVFTPFPGGNRENYTEVDTSLEWPGRLEMDLQMMVAKLGDPVELSRNGPRLSRTGCDIVYANDRLKEMLDGAGGEFDLILVEPLWADCVSLLAVKLEAPIIYAIPSPVATFLEGPYVGHVPNPATVSNMMSRHAVPKTFIQRLGDTALLVYGTLSSRLQGLQHKRARLRPYDECSFVPPSAIFLNIDRIIEASRPLAPNVIPVGGIHLGAVGVIPKDILEFIDDSPHGIIYFTFGSIVSMSTLPDHVHNAFKEALAKVPQRVLWKYEGEMKDKPNNVMTSKWFPQRDILMHPKVKLFISHGGMSGIYEAVDAGVPVLGFPLFYDQPRNIDNLVEAGMALSMDLLTIQKDLFLKNVLELINNDTYMKYAKIASRIFKDRSMSQKQSVVYWTEYVIRHKGAPHLKSQAFNLSWYQYFLLDVIVLVLFVFVLAFCITYIVLKLVKYCIFKLSPKLKSKSD